MVTWDNFKSLLQKPSVRYVYIATHGGTQYQGTQGPSVQKTNFALTGSRVLADRVGGDLPPESLRLVITMEMITSFFGAMLVIVIK